MSENEKTVSRRQAAEETAAKKKKKYFWIKIGVILCVIIGIVLSVYESNFLYRKLKAVEVNGTQYSVAEYNWFYTQNFYEIYSNLYSSYGSMTSYIIDTSKPLSSQNYSTDQTWADYIKEYTESSMTSMTALYDAGKAAGYEMSQDYYDAIDSEWASIESAAKTAGSTVSSYLVAAYGRGVNEKVYRAMYERNLYAYSYASETAQAEEVTTADIDAYYSENKDTIDTVSYRYYYVASTAADGEDAEAVKTAAKEKAEAALAAEDIDAYVATVEGEMKTSEYVLKSSVDATYADWLFDEARVAGEKELFETTSGYYVIEFTEKNDLHYNTVNVRHILVTPEDTSSDDSWNAALEEANGYLAEYEASEKTEDAFAALATEHSKDSGSATNGGLYEGIHKGQTVDEFEDWSFDPNRKAGDIGVIKSSYGYHVMYYVGEGAEYYTDIITKYVINQRYTDFVTATSEGYALTELSAIKDTAKHL